jgi:arylsulfatase A-like enzyme
MHEPIGSLARICARSVGAAVRLGGLKHPQSALAFLFLCAMYLSFKVCLGVFLVAREGYGFSWVAPPLSLLMASSDVVISFAAILALEKLIPRRHLGTALGATLASTAAFLLCNYSVYTYFKSFITYGLLRFNGAGTGELLDYLLDAVDGPFAAFAAACAALVAGFALAVRRTAPLERSLRRVGRLAALGAAAAGGTWGGLAQLGWDQTGRLVRDPLVDLVQSTAEGLVVERAAIPGSALSGFSPPASLVFGEAPRALPAGFTRPRLHRPNVLVVLVESLPAFETPLVDPASPLTAVTALRRHALVFDSYRTVFPATSRSLIALHCGAYPDTGFDTISRYMNNFDCAPFPAELAKAGYATGLFHASMLTYDNLDRTPVVRGYGAVEDYFTLKRLSARAGLTARAVEEEVVTGRVLDFMTRAAPRPFFATYFAYWTHSPYDVPGAAAPSGASPRDRYQRSLAYVNGAIEGLLRGMERRGLLDDTIVILTADHGEGLGLYHGTFNHSSHVYEEALRVPLVVRLPGLDRELHVARPGTHVDFAPTLFGLLGLDAPSAWEGQDLLAATYAPRPALVFSRSTRLANGIVDGNTKYMYYLDDDRAEHFYDLAVDPYEQRDLIASRRAQADRYREIIERWLPYEQRRITSRN